MSEENPEEVEVEEVETKPGKSISYDEAKRRLKTQPKGTLIKMLLKSMMSENKLKAEIEDLKNGKYED